MITILQTGYHQLTANEDILKKSVPCSIWNTLNSTVFLSYIAHRPFAQIVSDYKKTHFSRSLRSPIFASLSLDNYNTHWTDFDFNFWRLDRHCSTLQLMIHNKVLGVMHELASRGRSSTQSLLILWISATNGSHLKEGLPMVIWEAVSFTLTCNDNLPCVTSKCPAE